MWCVNRGAVASIVASAANVARGQTLIGYRALLKKQHPWSDGRSDSGQQE
jgi:hypothetical protein